ncbi:MAG: ABC transporter ATP-binding protein [Bdellovibrionota bacterium]
MSVEIQNLQKNFYQGETKIEVLKNVSAQIKKGEIVAIIGESGSGKSTLLSLLSGLDRADTGSIIVDTTDMSKLSERQMTGFRAANISIVFQQYHLLSHLTALENVMLPAEILSRENIKDDAKKLLSDMGLDHRLNHFPSQLSGGESQRVAIARALITKPNLLLADEPSGNLDTKTGDSVMHSFFDIVKKHQMTTLLVTHSEALAQRCQRVLRLENGVLVERFHK